jgi:hypothetical protein
MREIRTLELKQSEATTCWIIDQSHTLRVCDGLLWLTIEGDSEDHWLGAGASIDLLAGCTVWVSSATPESRFVLASSSVALRAPLFRLNWAALRTARNRIRMS